MTFGQFLAAIERDSQSLTIDGLLDWIDQVLNGIPEHDPRYAWLVAIEEKLLDDEIPRARLLALAERFPADPQLAFEERLRGQALALEERQLRSQALDQLMALRNQPQQVAAYCESMQRQLDSFWKPYAQPPASDAPAREIAARRLFEEGYQKWRQALDCLARPDGHDRALTLALEGNRLLVAVSRIELD